MDVSATSALSLFAYQSTLSQTGSKAQAVTQALAAGQSQAAETGSLLASVGTVDPITALSGGSVSSALTSMAYANSASSGNGPEAVQAMLAALGGGTSALLPSTDGLPVSAAALSPGATAAMSRYAYDQSQNPSATVQQALASARQSLEQTNLNLLA